jgi:hypothetical protein
MDIIGFAVYNAGAKRTTQRSKHGPVGEIQPGEYGCRSSHISSMNECLSGMAEHSNIFQYGTVGILPRPIKTADDYQQVLERFRSWLSECLDNSLFRSDVGHHASCTTHPVKRYHVNITSSDLPQTIRDAVAVCRSLKPKTGASYLEVAFQLPLQQADQGSYATFKMQTSDKPLGSRGRALQEHLLSSKGIEFATPGMLRYFHGAVDPTRSLQSYL